MTPSAPSLSNIVGQPVNGSAIEVTGVGEAGDTIALYADGGATSVGAGVVGDDGTFDITTTATFADGAHSLTATQTNADGTSALSASLAAPVAPVAPVLTALVGQVVSGWTIAVKGAQGQAGDTVTLYNTGVAIGTAVVAADGSFENDTTQKLNAPPQAPGAYTAAAFSVSQTDAAGIASAQSTPVNFNVANGQINLTSLAQTVHGSGTTDKVFAHFDSFNPADVIDVTGDTSAILGLVGAGGFDLSAPAQLSGFTQVQLHAATPGQTLTLRDGMNASVSVLGLDTDSATIHGANNSALIRLYHGADTVYLGSAAEQVQGGSGVDVVYASAAYAGASVIGAAGGMTLHITGGGTAVMNAADRRLQVVLDQATNLALGGSPTTVTGSVGDDTISATASQLKASLKLDGSGGSNTLALSGGGTFALDRLSTFANFSAINVTEGVAGAVPTVRLRAGQSLTVTVAAPAGTPAGPLSATILGANDSDTIKLGAGQDTVTLGSASEVVHGGSGHGVVVAKTAALAGALVTGGSGGLTLNVNGSGAVTLNASDTGVSLVNLLSPGVYTVVTPNMSGLTINDQGHAMATITLGGAGQTFTGGGAGHTTITCSAAGGDTVMDTAATLHHDTINGFIGAGNLIDITDLSGSLITGSFTENAAGTAGGLTVTDGSHTAFINLMGAFLPANGSASLAAAGFTTTTDGGAGVLIAFAPHH